MTIIIPSIDKLRTEEGIKREQKKKKGHSQESLSQSLAHEMHIGIIGRIPDLFSPAATHDVDSPYDAHAHTPSQAKVPSAMTVADSSSSSGGG